MSADIPFNRPPLAGTELEFLKQALEDRRLEGHGRFTREVQERLQAMTGCRKALLTHSCTSAPPFRVAFFWSFEYDQLSFAHTFSLNHPSSACTAP